MPVSRSTIRSGFGCFLDSAYLLYHKGFFDSCLESVSELSAVDSSSTACTPYTSPCSSSYVGRLCSSAKSGSYSDDCRCRPLGSVIVHNSCQQLSLRRPN